MWDDVTYPFPDFIGFIVEVLGMDESSISHFMMPGCNNLLALGLKLNHVDKGIRMMLIIMSYTS